jgi:micrococcal nuclease
MAASKAAFVKLIGYTSSLIYTSFLFFLIVLMLFAPLLSNDSFAHKSGCHRWHSCPSDTGSYECGDLGHDSQCGNNDDSKDEDNDDQREEPADDDNENTTPKVSSSEGIEMSGPVMHVADGDTLDVNGITIRLALVDTPEIGENGYESAKNFVKDLCLGNDAEVDIDDGQRGGDRYGREIGVVYCNGVNVNSALMEKQYSRIYTDYCDVSEFANEDWAECSSTNTQFDTEPVTGSNTPAVTELTGDNCDPSYSGVCIPSPPPDIDCGEISEKRFSVSGSDPHGFDRDGDGIGCES